MKKNFALYLQKPNLKKHKTPPLFNRAKAELSQHKIPPPFKRPALQETSLLLDPDSPQFFLHKTPPVFSRTLIKPEDLDKKFKRPPVVSKFPSLQSGNFSKIKNSGNWSFGDPAEERKDSSQYESSNEFLPGFDYKASGVVSVNSGSDILKLEDGMRRKDVSGSNVSSIIMQLQPEREDSVTKVEFFEPELQKNESSSEYSSDSQRKNIEMPKANLSKYFAYTEKMDIVHKLPPVFNRSNKEAGLDVPSSDSSELESLSNVSSVLETPDSSKKVFENLDGEQDLSYDLNNFISGISDIDKAKGFSQIRSSAGIADIRLDKSKSPFASNNIFEKATQIPMRVINYYERTFENYGIRFQSEMNLPDVPEIEKTEFHYTSVKLGTRGSSLTIFMKMAELPLNIKHHVSLFPPSQALKKNSNFSLKRPLTNEDLEDMAYKLAQEIINRKKR